MTTTEPAEPNEREDLSDLKGRLRSARKAGGWSQTQLAHLAVLPPGKDGKPRHVGPSHVALIERGERDNLTTEIASALCGVLGCSMDWLLLGKGAAPRGVRAA